ncbi:MAG TPA: hypothetical protein VHC19_02575 [Pirellulales bacterium]|jgi:hypothetical protein|nr:hypothetical protein [Pirellulales bacterium]
MLRTTLRFVAVAAVTAALSAPAMAADWGNLTGRFVFEGKAPEEEKIDTSKEPGCSKHPVFAETLVVNDEDKGIKDVVIYVSTKKVKVHPDYKKTAEETVVMDNKHCRFTPHILPMQLSQTLELHNSDPFSHNSNLAPIGDTPTNPLLSEGGKQEYHFHRAQKLPVPVSCNIHGWMKGYIVVRDNPYATVSDEHGKFELKNLPAGSELEFTVWQEKAGWLKAEKSWSKKGVFKKKIKAGDNDLGDIKVPASLFDK